MKTWRMELLTVELYSSKLTDILDLLKCLLARFRSQVLNLILLITMLLASYNSYSQGLYYLEYRFDNEVEIGYRALLDINSDGNGKIRVKFDWNHKSYLVEMNLTYQDIKFVDRHGDSIKNTVLYSGQNPKFINSKKFGDYIPDVIVFKLDESTKVYQPYTVYSVDKKKKYRDTELSYGEIKTWRPLNNSSEIRQLITEFEWDYVKPSGINGIYNSVSETVSSIWKRNSDAQFDPLKSSVHLILLTNTQDGETRFKENPDKIKSLFKNATYVLGTKLHVTELKDDEFSKQALIDLLKKKRREVKSDSDVIIFYYSGHGFRKNESNDPLPIMSLTDLGLTSEAILDRNAFPARALWDSLTSLKARTTILIAECCNNVPPLITPFKNHSTPNLAEASPGFRKDLLLRIFSSPGNVCIATCKPNETSWYDADGGFFCSSFYDSFKLASTGNLKSTDNLWNSMLSKSFKDTITKCKKIRVREQHGFTLGSIR